MIIVGRNVLHRTLKYGTPNFLTDWEEIFLMHKTDRINIQNKNHFISQQKDIKYKWKKNTVKDMNRYITEDEIRYWHMKCI